MYNAATYPACPGPGVANIELAGPIGGAAPFGVVVAGVGDEGGGGFDCGGGGARLEAGGGGFGFATGGGGLEIRLGGLGFKAGGAGGLGWVKPGAGMVGLGFSTGGLGELKLGLGKVAGGEMQEPSEQLTLFLWWLRRRSPNPKTRPRTTRTVTMKMKIFVALPT